MLIIFRDTDVDITDFNSLAANFSPEGYSATASVATVPEPAVGMLAVLGSLVFGILRR